MTKGNRDVPLGDLCKLLNGRAYKKSELLAEGPTPVLRVGNFFTNQNWYYSDLTLDSDKYCDDGDLLYAWSASFGPRIWDGGKAIYHYHIWKMLPDEGRLDKRYLYHFLDWDKEQIKFAQGAGATMIHVTKGSMEARHIPVPTLEEQRRIVEVLDEAFVAIATATANSKKNLANARELFNAEIRTAFSNPEPSWKWLTLGEAAIDFGRGKSKHRPRNDPKLYGGPYPFIQTGDVRNSDHLISGFSQSYSQAGLSQSKLWPRGTICITIAANIAETGILDFDACFPDSVIGMVVDPDVTTQHYVEYLLQSLKAVLQAMGKGSAQANINLATFENERFPFPPLAIQAEITERLDEAADCVRNLEALYEQKIRELDALKQSLLQRAFSGELTERESLAA